ncbi:inner membrane-spanning protein YciB [Reyranella soli]|jgi:intracellular septation protein A|uniref:Intracellular septation protein n=1 Tax=Reyranella soli TaxID=1230389 RepID=A0A512NFE7_9HYPH|nr:septation protein IspZ [Reyranella soli]GEP57673.1 intracellular septation protein [Reyranella soli]
MANLMHSARLLVSDLASTILFLVVLLITKDLMLAVALGVGLGIIQIGWMKLRRQPIDTMQWLSIGLVVVSGIATLLTSDARFVMLKPSVIYCIVGAYMLKPGWMNRYLPPIAVHLVPDLAWTFGFVWAGLMFLSAALNIALALTLDPVSWSATMSIWGLASKVALFLAQYGLMRFVGMRRAKAAMAQAAST